MFKKTGLHNDFTDRMRNWLIDILTNEDSGESNLFRSAVMRTVKAQHELIYVTPRTLNEVQENHFKNHHQNNTLRPAWQTSILTEHGVHSRDWKEYQEQIETITKAIDSIITGAFPENSMTWYEQLNGELNNYTIQTLEELGYVISDECTDCKKISW